MEGTNVVETSSIVSFRDIPYGVLDDDVSGTMRNDFFNELGKIKCFYNIYEKGADFTTDGSNGDYIPSSLRFKKARKLIDKEARFMFSTPLDFYVNKDQNRTEEQRKNNTILNNFLSKVLNANYFNKNVLKASKDCFIGKRVACMLNFNEESGIAVDFLSPLEFYYEMSGSDMLTKIVAFFVEKDASNNREKRIRKKSYWLEDDGFCWVEEKLYDGSGVLLEVITEAKATKFKYIPAIVILNDGLTNDTRGESEIENLADYEQYYSKLSNNDFDAERKSMNPIRYTINASSESTSNLSSSPGAYWDIQSDENGVESKQATVGQLESGMSYSTALKTTLDRIDNEMHSQASVPNVESEKLQGVITSGKTLKALYWPLIVRCDEKMQTWGASAQFIAKCIFDGATLYPGVVKYYSNEDLPIVEVDISVENNYALPEDEEEEKQTDLAEVSAQTMSRSSYMKKWRKLTDEEVQAELEQIALEQEMLNGNSSGYIPTDRVTSTDGDVNGIDDSKLEQPDVVDSE